MPSGPTWINSPLANIVLKRTLGNDGERARRRRWWMAKGTRRRPFFVIRRQRAEAVPAVLLLWPVVALAGIVEAFVVANEVVDQEVGLADAGTKTTAAPAHLGILDGRGRRSEHDEVLDLLVVVAGVEHVHRDGHDRQRVELEAVNDRFRVAIVGVAGDLLGEGLANLARGTVGLFGYAKTGDVRQQAVE